MPFLYSGVRPLYYLIQQSGVKRYFSSIITGLLQ